MHYGPKIGPGPHHGPGPPIGPGPPENRLTSTMTPKTAPPASNHGRIVVVCAAVGTQPVGQGGHRREQ